MTGTVDAWERIKLYAYQHAHPDDTERIRADVEEIEGLLDDRPVTDGTARTPAVDIDRDALVMLIDGWGAEQPLHLADAVRALVRSVEGVVLSREEAELAAPALRNAAARHATASGAAWHALAADLRALAARLEAAS